MKELVPGQYEFNLHHVDNPLQAADNAQLLKQALENGSLQQALNQFFERRPVNLLEAVDYPRHRHVQVEHQVQPGRTGVDYTRNIFRGTASINRLSQRITLCF